MAKSTNSVTTSKKQCSECKYWSDTTIGLPNALVRESLKRCNKIGDFNTPKMEYSTKSYTATRSSNSDTMMVTKADFYCNEWVKKPK